MLENFTSYARSTFSGELTNALFIGIIFGLVVNDLRQYFSIETFFLKSKIKNFWIKIICFGVYYIILVSVGLLGVFFVVFLLWLISLI